ncbi:MAG TPA: hypothetical protein PKY87_10470 [Terricaulis sp.]|nr:hypothetical protein [Terricaulis sp.]
MLQSVRALPVVQPQFAKTFGPLALACAIGAASMLAPHAALLLLAALGAFALMNTRHAQLDLPALAGPGLAALLVGAFTGLAGAIGVLFIWRLYSDARWSVNEARRLNAAAGRPEGASTRAFLHAWASPLFGLALVAYTAPHMVAGLPLDLPHIPLWAVLIVGGLAALLVFDWALKCAADWRLGEFAAAPAAHLLAHHLMFILAFGLMIDVSAGIVAMIAWRLAHAGANRMAQPSFTAVP